jgi:hypothetical protein
MLLKFLKPGAHDEPGSMRYVLKNPTARVVRGNPGITQWVIDQSPSGLRQKFVSGVINDLASLDSIHDELLLDELEGMFLAKRPPSAMPWCVIEHTDKGKREFHFICPLFDLMFGKYISPYVDRIDRKAFQAWVEHFALRFNLDFPRENLRVKPAFEHLLTLRKCDREFLEGVWNQVRVWVAFGQVTCRTDLERQLRKEGYKVRFTKHDGGQLQQPVILGPDGNALRLTNSIYYQPEFGHSAIEPLDRSNDDAVAARLVELEGVLRDWHKFRAFHSLGRFFGKAQQKGLGKRKPGKLLKLLMAERLVMENQIDDLVGRIDYSSVLRSAAYVESGLPTEITTLKTRAHANPQITEADDQPVIPTKDNLPAELSIAEERASPEPFQSPEIGGIRPPEIAAVAAVDRLKPPAPKNPGKAQNPSDPEGP